MNASLHRTKVNSYWTDLGRLSSAGLADLLRERVGIIFQRFHLLPSLSALDSPALPLKMAGASGSRHLYAATVMHALGARHRLLRRLLQWRLDMSPAGLYWSGLLTASGASAMRLGLGAHHLLE
jgi:ABC-type ATPase involved in cell division